MKEGSSGHYTATYSPDDNKLRLYALTRLPADVYARVKAAGFAWAPKQDLFVAPAWTPLREDLLLELAGEIGDEDTSLVDRAESRAERFEGYGDRRMADAEAARTAVSAIADNIPLGQPILVGHHSERHARRDAERIESGMRRAVKMWETSQYWTSRAAGAVRAAKYKERPDVRARRIKGLESEQRKQQKIAKEQSLFIRLWGGLTDAYKDGRACDEDLERQRALWIANRAYVYMPEVPGQPYRETVWGALDKQLVTPREARRVCLKAHARMLAHTRRWLGHLENRLSYERAILADAGGLVSDKTAPEKGGGARCWAGPRGGWAYIQKVNRVSVTVLDNWGNGGRNFTRTIPFDKLQAVMSKADVVAKREAGLLVESADKTGFFLLDSPPPPVPKPAETDQAAEAFGLMRETVKAGIEVVAAPQLFPTPSDLAARMVAAADIAPGMRVLEPSAGTGVLLEAARAAGGITTAVEIDARLCGRLRLRFDEVRQADFLDCGPDALGAFDRVVMNPPFAGGKDIQHVKHALTLLAPAGRLVALCANGSRQQEQLKPLADTWEELPAGTFDGTNVRAALLTITRRA